MNWTKEQAKAIEEKGKILVAAAAGSGKTAVLVERIIRKVINDKINIDEMLVVTFTKAAASEMKEKILNAIYKALEKEPNNLHLNKQLKHIENATISTIHSFCLSIIKTYFYKLNLSPNIKVGTTEELHILKQEAIETVLEKEYEKQNKDFLNFVHSYSGYRNDDNIKNIILEIYNFFETVPFNKDWKETFEKTYKQDMEQFNDTKLGSEIFLKTKTTVKNSLRLLEKEKERLKDLNLMSDGFEKPIEVLSQDILKLNEIFKANNWDELYEKLWQKDLFIRWASIRKEEIKIETDISKEIRDRVKKDILSLQELVYAQTSDIKEEFKFTEEILECIYRIVDNFKIEYINLKNNKDLIDYSDLENYSLQLLLEKASDSEIKEDENRSVRNKKLIGGKYKKTNIAKEITNKYKEIAIDEYQDINLVQEYILSSVTGKNIFQVGDIKQSIYKFRNARPDLFLGKYNSFEDVLKNENPDIKSKDNVSKQNVEHFGKKIKLFKNFRSRKNVLDISNHIFSHIMTEEAGEIEYTEDEYLNLGLEYLNENIDNNGNIDYFTDKNYPYIPEVIYVRNSKQQAQSKREKQDNLESLENLADLNSEDYLTEEELTFLEEQETIETQAECIKDKIQEIMQNENFFIHDGGKEKRRPQYKDFAILLRSATKRADIIEKTLFEAGIPAYTEQSDSFLNSNEIIKVVSLLKVIDNPNDDLELATVLRSYFADMSLNEITEIVVFANKVLKETNKAENKVEKDGNIQEQKNDINNIKEIREIKEEIETEENSESINLKRNRPEDISLFNKLKIYLNDENSNILNNLNIKYIKEEKTFKKVLNFFKLIKKFEKTAKYYGLSKLLSEILYDTGYLRYVSLTDNGNIKRENLKLFLDKATTYEKQGNISLYRFIKYIEKISEDNASEISAKLIGEKEDVVRIMTIHKSKGLEFPIVILADSNKKINEQDLRKEYLFHEKHGIGLKYVDIKNNVTYDGIIKRYIKQKVKDENLAEEMRIFYVALTRAREKLIILGSLNKKYESYKEYFEELEIELASQSEKYLNKPVIDPEIIKRNSTYMDWISLVILKDKNYPVKIVHYELEDEKINVGDLTRQRLYDKKIEKMENIKTIENIDEEIITKIDNIFNKEMQLKEIQENLKEELNYSAKMSVSELLLQKQEQIFYERPKYITEDGKSEFTGKEKGDIVHGILQKLDFRQDWTIENLKSLLIELQETEVYTEKQINSIDLNQIIAFLNSDIYFRIKNAKEINKEKNIYSKISIEKLENILNKKQLQTENIQIDNKKEEILLQGVIDMYFIDEEDKLIILDYKTDYIKNAEELKKRYEGQINIYAYSLEEALEKSVDEKYIYSTTLSKLIKID